MGSMGYDILVIDDTYGEKNDHKKVSITKYIISSIM